MNPYSNIKSKVRLNRVKSNSEIPAIKISSDRNFFGYNPKIDTSDLNFIYSRYHNASTDIGPGYYNLPEIPKGRKITFGHKYVKKQYYPEYSLDFRGSDSPAFTIYTPIHKNI
jgi:hypothetical protein